MEKGDGPHMQSAFSLLKRDSDIKWETGSKNQYTGPSGGTLVGPSQNIFRLAGTSKSLDFFCMSMIPLYLFQQVATITNNYANKD